MEIIQRKFRLNKLNKLISKLNIHTTDKSFDEFSLLIQKKDVINKMSYILTLITHIANYGNNIPISSRAFLASFIISDFHKDVLSQSTGPIRPTLEVRLNEIIHKDARELVNKLSSLFTINDVNEFHRMIVLYNSTFKAWKNMDLKGLIHTLTTSYYELDIVIQSVENENTMNNEYSIEEYISLCKEHQENIINKIIFLNGQEYFNNYRHVEISIDDSLKQHIQDTLYKAYWDILKKELDSDPPIFNQLIMILSEIRDLFCKFVPNRQDIQQEIKDKIDPDLIKNMVEHQAFDDDNLYKLSMYMISLIEQFQPPIMDTQVKEWKESMIETLKQPLVYSEFLGIFLRSVFNMIQSIMKYLEIAEKDLI
jgi:hypothetical protein